jgi:hypothetical protein
MTEIQMTKSPRRGHPIKSNNNPGNNCIEIQCHVAFVLDFEHLNFEFVWSLRDFVLRASDLGRF